MLKATYGTGCFALLNAGGTRIASNNRLLATVAYQRGGERRYALEGSIFVAGASVQWLRDGPARRAKRRSNRGARRDR
jgi:glycerol kinase